MDLELLASTLTILLAQSLPFLQGLGKQAVEEGVKSFVGEKTKTAAKALELLEPELDKRPLAAAAIDQLKHGQDSTKALYSELLNILRRHDELALRLGELTVDLNIDDHRIVVGGEVSGGQIAAGDGNIIVGNLYMGSPSGAPGVTPSTQSPWTPAHGGLRPRPRGPFVPEFCVSRAASEREIVEQIDDALIGVVWGPLHAGKTWLLQQVYHKLAEDRPGVRQAFVSLQTSIDPPTAEEAQMQPLKRFLHWLTCRMLESIGETDGDPASSFTRPDSGTIAWRRAIRRFTPEAPNYFLLVLDDADRLIDSDPELAEDFFKLLRANIDSSGRDLPGLRLLLAISTAPSTLVRRLPTSPFDVVPPTRLSGFTRRELAELAAIYRVQVEERELEILEAWTKGHPYLSSLAFARLRRGENNLSDLLNLEGARIFEDHLRDLDRRLEAVPELRDALRKVAYAEPLPDWKVESDLEAIGLIERSPPRLRLPDLYRRLIKEEAP